MIFNLPTQSFYDSPAQGSLPGYLTLNCRREILICHPAQEGKQHSGEVGVTSSPLWSPTQTKASLVVCTPLAICPAAKIANSRGCSTTTSRDVRRPYGFKISRFLVLQSFLITADVSGHLSPSFYPVPACGTYLPASPERVPSSGNFSQLQFTLQHADTTEHVLNLSQLEF